MSYSSNYVLNERVSYLEFEINNIAPTPPGGYTLANILANGNSAGVNDIDMNQQNINDCSIVTTNSITLPASLPVVSPCSISNTGTGDLSVQVELGKNYSVQSPPGFPRLTVGATSVLVNGIPLYLNSTNNIGFDTFIGGTNSLTITANDANGSIRLSVANGSGVASVPFIINSATTTISNATTINTLATTTQANGTNNTTVATTAFVQNAIGLIPTPVSLMPYFRFSATTNVNSTRYLNPFGFQFTGSSWGANDFFTVRLTVSSVVRTGTPNNYNLTAVFDIYPNRCPATSSYGSNSNTASTVATSGFPQMNGAIYSGGQYVTAYTVPVDATFAPFGRYYYVSSFNLVNNLGIAIQPNCLPLYPYITQATQQTNFGFQLWAVSTIANPTDFSVNAEIISNTTSNAITSYGVNQFSNFYNTF